jgi:hypothetical protein
LLAYIPVLDANNACGYNVFDDVTAKLDANIACGYNALLIVITKFELYNAVFDENTLLLLE